MSRNAYKKYHRSCFFLGDKRPWQVWGEGALSPMGHNQLVKAVQKALGCEQFDQRD